MAFWQRKKNKYVMVYYWGNGKQIALPRASTKHLDNAPDSEINAWVKQLKITKVVPDYHKYETPGGITVYYAGKFIEFLKAEKKLDPKSISGDYTPQIYKRILPYFLHHGCKHPNEWPGISIKMRDWLRQQGESEATIYRTNHVLKKFWGWMCDERIVSSSHEIRVRLPISALVRPGETPLKTLLQPNEILSFVAREDLIPYIRFVVLVGYFFSIRPQEIFALGRESFVAGPSNIQQFETVKSFKRAGINPRLVVSITRHRKDSGVIAPSPLRKPGGIVPCWNHKAEELIVEFLSSYDIGEPIIPVTNDRVYSVWEKEINPILGCTMKDLRRASIHYLGHHTEIASYPFALRDYARHKDIKTTLLYMRRPKEVFEAVGGELDLFA